MWSKKRASSSKILAERDRLPQLVRREATQAVSKYEKGGEGDTDSRGERGEPDNDEGREREESEGGEKEDR